MLVAAQAFPGPKEQDTARASYAAFELSQRPGWPWLSGMQMRPVCMLRDVESQCEGTKRIGTKRRVGDRASLRIPGTVGPLFVCNLKSVQVASSIDDITAVNLGARFRRGRRARLIAVSGIDGSGK